MDALGRFTVLLHTHGCLVNNNTAYANGQLTKIRNVKLFCWNPNVFLYYLQHQLQVSIPSVTLKYISNSSVFANGLFDLTENDDFLKMAVTGYIEGSVEVVVVYPIINIASSSSDEDALDNMVMNCSSSDEAALDNMVMTSSNSTLPSFDYESSDDSSFNPPQQACESLKNEVPRKSKRIAAMSVSNAEDASSSSVCSNNYPAFVVPA